MKEYWPKRLGQSVQPAHDPAGSVATSTQTASRRVDEPEEPQDSYDRARMQRLRGSQSADGWKAELERYLADPAADVKKTTDTVSWWSVSSVTPLLRVVDTLLNLC